MEVYNEIAILQNRLSSLFSTGQQIGFVPTMGALHQGHLALVKEALAENDCVVCSIFVNPTQFDNAEDLLKYPRLEVQDLELLTEVGCQMVFMPSAQEMYPEGFKVEHYEFGSLQQVMEGASRPGHFDGVATVVRKLFDAVKPHRAYFGKKDYQQLLIIKAMVHQMQLPIEIVPCETFRETDGLAMSSRNLRLSDKERTLAPVIYQILQEASIMAGKYNASPLKLWVQKQLDRYPSMELVYFEIANPEDLSLTLDASPSKNQMGFIVVKIGGVRLIDNILL